jgi:uncharacterized membrane protein YoaT (DUF817 family)
MKQFYKVLPNLKMFLAKAGYIATFWRSFNVTSTRFPGSFGCGGLAHQILLISSPPITFSADMRETIRTGTMFT